MGIAKMAGSKIGLTVAVVYMLITIVRSLRYGLSSETLYFPATSDTERLGNGFHSVTVPDDAEGGGVLSRHRRQATSQPGNPPISLNLSHMSVLNDSHYQMIIHWAGEDSDVIVALTKDINPTNISTTSVFISQNYGISFADRQELSDMKINRSIPAVFDKFYNSPVYNSHYVFADVMHNVTFTTTDYGKNMRQHNMPFSPRQISLHAVIYDTILGYDDLDPQKKLWISRDFGHSWRVLQVNVKSFFWGKQPWDTLETLYVERREPGHSSIVLRSTDYFASEPTTLIYGVEDFELREEYLFATKNKGTPANKSLELWVSYYREDFRRADFPDGNLHQEYYVADASEDQVFLCVNHKNLTTHLYISDVRGLKFSLSLENVVYFNPKGANKDTWLRYYVDESFADVLKVDGLRGIYIASKLSNGSALSSVNQSSYITFNKGGSWWLLTAPEKDILGKDVNCSMWNWKYGYSASPCSLHLSQKFHQYYPSARSVPLLSKKSAVGLIMGTGQVGRSINVSSDVSVFISTDGGWGWKEVLKEAHFYTFGDHGGLIVAIRQDIPTGEIMYSYDEGQTWLSHEFSSQKMRVYGVITEPGEKTTVFSVFGSRTARHSWVIVQVNLSSVFTKKCTDDDYKDWSPSDNERIDCLLGRKLVFKRRRANALCFNGKNYDQPVIAQNCSCTIQDYECDLGFKKASIWSNDCVRDPSSNINPHRIPSYCPEDTFYPRTKGYRRIAGDTCVGGEMYRFEPEHISCPDREAEDFIIYTTRNSIHKYVFDDNRDEILPVAGLVNTVSVEYDYKRNCLYWADAHFGHISKLCFDGNSSQQVIVSERADLIESLALDWTSDTLYFIDAHNKKIEVCKLDGYHRRVLIDDHLDKPRALVLDPKLGIMFWTDWSATNPRIMRSNMDGTNITTVINGTRIMIWPNGLAIDAQFDTLYWTDAQLDRISTIKTDGTGYKVLIRSSSSLPHPYAIRVYKDQLYWTDWSKRAIMVADKNTGRGIDTFRTDLPGVMDLKLMNQASQSSTSVCKNNSNCRSLCLLYNDQGDLRHGCLCSDAYKTKNKLGVHNEECLCETGEGYTDHDECALTNGTTCSIGQFMCKNNRCLPSTWKCDGDNDCGDLTDELDCPYRTCTSEQFKCANGHCITASWVCDYDDDCGDSSDEQASCSNTTCGPNEFACANGRCIRQDWVCDGDNDCHDGSDELDNCTSNSTRPSNCSDGFFLCDNGRCITSAWECDGDNDCMDNSDEANCNGTSPSPQSCLGDFQFRCPSGQCIYRTWLCDGDRDCPGGEDEEPAQCALNGTTSMPYNISCDMSYSFMCDSGGCVPVSVVCDGVNDCGDYSDEQHCGPGPPSCGPGMYTCRSGQCVPGHLRCDGRVQCHDGSDEDGCQTTPYYPHHSCGVNQFTCGNGQCIFEAWICDGDRDCSDGTDEEAIPCSNTTSQCKSGEFKCEFSGGCIPGIWVCDGAADCGDGSDEKGCSETTSVGPQFTTTWPVPRCMHYEMNCGAGVCIPMSARCDGHFDCLSGADEVNCTRYHLTNVIVTSSDKFVTFHWEDISPKVPQGADVKVRVSYRFNGEVAWHYNLTSSHTFKIPNKRNGRIYFQCWPIVNGSYGQLYTHQYTISLAPAAPSDFQPKVVASGSMSHMSIHVSWKPPAGSVTRYRIYYKDNALVSNEMHHKDINQTSYTIWQGLKAHHDYTLYVTAIFENMESQPSEKVTINLSLDCVQLVGKPVPTDTSVSVKVKYTGTAADVTHLRVNVSDSLTQTYISLTQRLSPDGTGNFTVTGLSPGITYQMTVEAALSNVEFRLPCDYNGIGFKTSGMNFMCECLKTPAPILAPVQSKAPGEVDLAWNHPNIDSETVFRIFYDKNNFYRNTKSLTVTGANSTKISSLESCEMYFFKVQVMDPKRSGFSNIEDFKLGPDGKGPPKNVTVEVKNVTSQFASLVVHWQPPCDEREKMLYWVNLVEEGSLTNRFEPQPTDKLYISYTITKLKRGATYTVTVQQKGTDSRPSEGLSVTVAPYPAPTALMVVKDTMLNTYYLSWEAPKISKDVMLSLKYEIFHSEDDIYQKNGNYSYYTTVNKTDYFAHNLDPGRDHSFKVRVESVFGYPGVFSQSFTVHTDSDKAGHTGPAAHTDSSVNQTTLVAILVPCSIVFLILMVVLGVYVIRHRRLQRSFLSFANSHYDTRSGTTTFSSDDLDAEEEPMIRGFSDDEPLVIA